VKAFISPPRRPDEQVAHLFDESVGPSVGLSVSMVPPDVRSRKPPLRSPIEKATVLGRAPPLLPLQFDLINAVLIKGLHEPHTPDNVCEVFLAARPRARFASWGTWSRTTDVSLRLQMGFSRASYLHASHLRSRSAGYLSHRSLPSLVLHHLLP
jgi:hypothetical protein